MKQTYSDAKRILVLSGTIIAFMIGSAFASGQEVLQYYAAFGLKGCIFGGFITYAVFFLITKQVLTDGMKQSSDKTENIFQKYLGKKLGILYRWCITILIYLAYIVMLSGCGSVFREQFGIPSRIGVLFMAVCTALTVMIGLHKLVNILGFLGPLLIIVIFSVSLISVFTNFEGILLGNIEIQYLPVKKISSCWWLSAFNYSCFALSGAYMFYGGIGKSCKPGDPQKIAFLSSTFFIITIILMGLATLGHIDEVYRLDIPIAYIADLLIPGFGSGFSLIMICGIFTTAVPMLWQSSNAVCRKGKSKKYYLLVLLLVAGACVVAQLPFARLVNIIFPIQGYLGVALVSATLVRSTAAVMRSDEEVR